MYRYIYQSHGSYGIYIIIDLISLPFLSIGVRSEIDWQLRLRAAVSEVLRMQLGTCFLITKVDFSGCLQWVVKR